MRVCSRTRHSRVRQRILVEERHHHRTTILTSHCTRTTLCEILRASTTMAHPRLTDQAGAGTYSYDAVRRLGSESRTINGVNKNLSYTYNLDSSVATVKYPSGAVITYTPDSAGRVLSAVDTGNNINYATGATYGP